MSEEYIKIGRIETDDATETKIALLKNCDSGESDQLGSIVTESCINTESCKASKILRGSARRKVPIPNRGPRWELEDQRCTRQIHVNDPCRMGLDFDRPEDRAL